MNPSTLGDESVLIIEDMTVSHGKDLGGKSRRDDSV